MNNEQNFNNQNIESLNQSIPPVMGPMPPKMNEEMLNNQTSIPGVVNPSSMPQDQVVSASTVNNPTMNTLNTNESTPIPTIQNINLQPEGVVREEPKDMMQSVGEPLMSTPLTPNTNLNNQGFAMPNNNGMYTDPMNGMNNMNQNMMPNNQIDLMGGVPIPPPIPNEPTGKKQDKKGKSNKIALIILIVVLIAGVGFGIYYFLTASKAKTKVTITPVLTEVELGTKLELVASNFVKVSGFDITKCNVETNLNTSKYGTYEYKVTCGTASTTTKTVTVKDTQAPVVVLKDVIVTPNKEVKPEDFFEKIEDASEYTLEFESDINTSVEGTYEIEITISDEYDNSVTVTGNLIVNEEAPSTYLICSKEEEREDPIMEISYRFGISNNGNRYNTKRTVTLTYETEENYELAKKEYEEEETIEKISGDIEFNDEDMIVTINTMLTEEEILEAFETDTVPTTEDEIQALFENECELSLN